ncbi:hypothetical protein [Mesorhizobium sp. WSM3859]|uniref:hypothetical protein n=1 Tax=Mesorhizobium sp. WSM3859 TaxID=2029402 RepID=UPI000BAF902D|nr:hypothetical protein [Mesorhizobium sp. WSM3859]PBC06374.1 hypothetical protein CK230_32175 [Mesorhizobium sp. WSM3859]
MVQAASSAKDPESTCVINRKERAFSDESTGIFRRHAGRGVIDFAWSWPKTNGSALTKSARVDRLGSIGLNDSGIGKSAIGDLLHGRFDQRPNLVLETY